jgi:hypothetical protein
MAMSAEKRRGLELGGLGREKLVEAVAKDLHANESMHLHRDVGSRIPCGYCWLRAGRAVGRVYLERPGDARLGRTVAEKRCARTEVHEPHDYQVTAHSMLHCDGQIGTCVSCGAVAWQRKGESGSTFTLHTALCKLAMPVRKPMGEAFDA